MDSASWFLKAWLGCSSGILGYAWVDLHLRNHLVVETAFSLTPDFSRIGDLWDWGGRLLHHGAHGLLVLNALAVGGGLALVIQAGITLARRLRAAPPVGDRISITTPSDLDELPPRAN